jgi:hypothetical protein
MFEKIKLTPSNLTLPHLFEALGIPAYPINFQALENKLSNAINSVALYLTTENWDHKQCETVVQFFNWAMVNRQDPAHTSIIFQMRDLLFRNPQPQNALMRLFFDGLSDGIKNDGKVFSVDSSYFPLWIEALSTLPKPLSVAGRDFLFKYDTQKAYADAQRQLEKGTNDLLNNPVFAYLSNNYVFEFSKTYNKMTGAFAYHLEASFKKGLQLIEHYPGDRLNFDLQNMVTDIVTTLTPVLRAFDNARSSQPSRLLAYMNASEPFCFLIIALQIGASIDPLHQSALNSIMADPIVSDIYNRSLTGNFPINARNEDIQKLEIAELYLQRDLAEKLLKNYTIRYS